MDIKNYFQLFLHWILLLVIGLILGVAGGYIYSRYQPRVYQSNTKILVSSAPDQVGTDIYQLQNSNYELAQTYIQLLTTQPVLDGAEKNLGYSVNDSQIKAQLVRDTSLIEVTVQDLDPKHAAEIANTLVSILIQQNDKIQSSRFASSEESLKVQLADLEKQIASLEENISQASEESLKIQTSDVKKQIDSLQEKILQVQQEINVIKPPQQSSEKDTVLSQDQLNMLQEKELRLQLLQSTLNFYQSIYLNLSKSTIAGSGGDSPRLDQMRSNLTQYQNIYANLLSSYEAIRLARLRSTPNIVQVEMAMQSDVPIRPRPIVNSFLGALIGLAIAVGVVFLAEYLDDAIKHPEEIAQLAEVPVIGYIPEFDAKDDEEKMNVAVAEEPRSPIAEAFRSLRTNLEFSNVDQPPRTLLISSPSPAEGKTTVSVNIAMSLVQSGKRVILVDADMRRPKIHRFLGLSNRIGLSDIFHNHRTIQAIARPWRNTQLHAITSGSLPPNPGELLGSEKMVRFLENAKEICDMVVIDCPPLLISDASVLASRVDAVLLVVNPGRTAKGAVKATVEQLKHVNAHLIGVVFNRIPKDRREYYGGYYHYSKYYKRGYDGYYNYYYSENGHKKKKGLKEIDQPDFVANNPEETDGLQDEATTKPIRINRN